jgi:hypothetical protein
VRSALLLAALAVAPAASGPPAASARAEKGRVRLGEPFGYEIAVRHAAAERWELPAELDLGPFRASAGACRREERRGGAHAVTTCTLTLSLLDLGAHDVPALRLRGATPAGESALEVAGPRVEAEGVIDPALPASALELRDLAPPVPLLVETWRPVAWAAALLGAAAAAWTVRRALRRRREGARPAAPAPPHERLARRLDVLEAEGLARRGAAREHWFRLSEIVREILAASTGVDAPDLTTEEILTALGRRPDPRIDLAGLRAFSEEADQAKFARDPSSEARCAAGISWARRLLSDTRPPAAGASPAPSRSDR